MTETGKAEDRTVATAGGGAVALAPPSQAVAAVGMAAAAQAEIRLAIELAINYPRNEDDCRGRVMNACKRLSFAEKALWSFRRGKQQISGPSIRLAEEIAKHWRHLRYGTVVVEDDEEKRTVRGYAWDLETNTRREADVSFNKMIYRKVEGWIPADERELFELTNRNGAKVVRNAILGIIPFDLIEDLIAAVRDTVAKADRTDPEAVRKRMVDAFASRGVSGAELTAYVGCALEQVRDTESLGHLRAVFNRMADGEASWSEIVEERARDLGLTSRPTTAVEMRRFVEAQVRDAREAQAAQEARGKK